MTDINKFSFGQMTSNSDGKTSGSGSMGVYIIVLSVIAFLFGCVDKACISHTTDVMMYSSANILVGAGLLGYRKSVDKTTIENANNPKETVSLEPNQ